MAEPYFVPISPHNANGSLQIVAGIHVMMTVPNFYRLEHCVSFIPTYNSFLEDPIFSMAVARLFLVSRVWDTISIWRS